MLKDPWIGSHTSAPLRALLGALRKIYSGPYVYLELALFIISLGIILNNWMTN